LASDIGTLAVFLSRIVRDRKENMQQLIIADLGRIIAHPHRFGMGSAASADFFIIGIGLATARIARFGRADAANMFENALDAPETTAGKNRNLRSLGFAYRCGWRIDLTPFGSMRFADKASLTRIV
jgi:hypothetical protein